MLQKTAVPLRVINGPVDPISGEPEFKHTPATVEPFGVDWYGFLLSRRPLELVDLAYWARSSGALPYNTRAGSRDRRSSCGRRR